MLESALPPRLAPPTFVLPLLDQALSHLSDVVLITEAEPTQSPGPRIVFVNAAFERMTGYSAEEVYGNTPRMLQGPRTDPAQLDRLRAALDTWTSERVTLTNYRKDGRPFNVEFDTTPIADERGWYTHWVSIQRDVTRETVAEDVLQRATTLDELAHGVCHELLDFTTATTVLWRMRPRGQQHWHVVHAGALLPFDAQGAEASDQCVLVSVVATAEWDAQLVLWSETGAIDAEQRALATAVAHRAAPTAEKLYAQMRQQRLTTALHQAEKLEAVGRLAGGIAHDFNNLLTVVAGNAEYLQSIMPDTEEVAAICGDINGATTRAGALVQRLLDFGRQRVPTVQPFPVDGVIASATALLERTLGAPIALVTAIEAPVPIALGDPALLEQVLVSLVLNARDALVSMMMPDRGEIRIVAVRDVVDVAGHQEYAAALRPGRYVAIDVTDDGPGMTNAVRDRAFEPFFSTKPPGAPGEGVGLGLSTAHSIVTMMGGAIHLENVKPHGLCVRILLPAA